MQCKASGSVVLLEEGGQNVPEKLKTGCGVEKAYCKDMPKQIKAILLDYKDIFPMDLSPRLLLG